MKFTAEDIRNPQSPQDIGKSLDADDETVAIGIVSADAQKRLGVSADMVSASYDETSKRLGYTGGTENQLKQAQERERTVLSRREQRTKRYQMDQAALANEPKPTRAEPTRADIQAEQRPTADERSKYTLGNLFRGGGASTSYAGWSSLAGTIDMILRKPADFIYGDNLRRVAEGADIEVGSFADLGKITAGMRELARSSDEAFDVPEEFRHSTLGKLVQGGGSLVPAVATMGMSSFGQMYTEAIMDTEDTYGLRLNEMSEAAQKRARQKAFIYGIVGGGAEFAGAKILGLTKMFKGGAPLPKGVIVESLKAGSKEGGMEAAQGQLLDTLAVIIEGDDRDLISQDVFWQRVEEAALGSAVGAAARSVSLPLEVSHARREILDHIDANLDAIAGGAGTSVYGTGGNLSHDVIIAMEELKAAEKEGDAEKIEAAQAKFAEAAKASEVNRAVGGDIEISQNLLKALDPIEGATEVDWNYINENFSDEQVARHMHEITGDGDIVATALLAKRGNKEAQASYVDELTVDKSQDLPEIAGLTPEERAERAREESGEAFVEPEIDPISIDQSEGAQGAYDAEIEGRATPEAIERMTATRQAVDEVSSMLAEKYGDTVDFTNAQDQLVTFQEEVDAKIAEGMSEEDAQKYARSVITDHGLDPDTALSDLRIEGRQSSVIEDGVFKATVEIFKGSSPLTVFEEFSHVYYDQVTGSGEVTVEKVLGWKAAVQEEGGTQFPDTPEGAKEWIAYETKAWVTGERGNDTSALPEGFRKYIEVMMKFVSDVVTYVRRGAELRKMDAEGNLPAEMKQFMERSAGLDADNVIAPNPDTRSSAARRDASFSMAPVTPGQDAEYMAAVESGDTDKAQEMVDDAARAAGYDRKVYHGTPNGDIDVFKADTFVTEDKGYAKKYETGAAYAEYKESEGRKTFELLVKAPNIFDTRIAAHAAILSNEFSGVYGEGVLTEKGLPDWVEGSDIAEFLKENYAGEYSGVILDEGKDESGDRPDSIIIFNPEQIKSADPVTYDANGDPIPLSERFNEEDPRISYSIAPIEEGESLLPEELDYLRLKEALTVGEDPTDTKPTEAERTLDFLMASLEDADDQDVPRIKREIAAAKKTVASEGKKAKSKENQAVKDQLKAAYTKAKIARLKQDARDTQRALSDSWKTKMANAVAKRTEAIRAKAEGDAEAVTEAIKELEMLQAQLPADIRGKLGGFGELASKKTNAGRKSFLLRRSEMMMRLMSKYALKSHRAELRKTLKQYGSKAKRMDRKLAESVGNKSRDMLRVAHYYANWKEGDAEISKPARLSDDEFEATTETFRGVMRGDVEPVRVYEAVQAAKAIDAEGRFERKQFIEDRREERSNRQKDALKEVLDGDRRMTELERRDAEQKQTIWQRLWQMQGDFMSGLTEGAELMFRRLDGARDGWFRKEFFAGETGIGRSALRYKRNMQNDNDEYMSRLSSEVFIGKGDADITNQLTSWGISADSGIVFSVEGGKPESQKLSVQQAVTLRLLLADRTLDSTFAARHNITEDNRAEVMKQIDDFIGDEGIAYADMLADLYAQYGVEVGVMFKSLEGFDLDLVENYSPLKRAAFGKDDTDGSDPFGSMVKDTAGATAKGGALKSRVDTTTEFRILPADLLFGQHIEFKNRYLAFAPLEQKIRDTFHGSKGDVRGAIEQKHGKEFASRLYKLFDQTLSGRLEGEKNMATSMLSKLRSNAATSVLMIKPKITATQLGSIPAYIDEMPAGEWLKYNFKFYKNWRKNMQTMLDTEFLKDRLTNAQNSEILETMNRQRSLFPNVEQWRQNSVNRLMFNVKFGDVGAIVIGGWPVYQYTFDQAKKRGASDAEAKAEAETAFTEASAVQQSTEIHTRGHFYRTSELARALLLFRTSPLLYQGKVQASIREASQAYVNQRKGKISKAERKKIMYASAKAMAIYHAVLPQIYYAISSGFVGFWHDDEDVRSSYWKGAAATLALGNIGAIPIGGGILAYATGASTFAPTASDAGAQKLIDASMRAISTDVDDLNFDDFMGDDNSKAANAITSIIDITTGYGSKSIYNMIKGAMDTVDDADPGTVMQTVGWGKKTFE